uniref:Glycoside hydrolase n=1 Tax=Meloidogyne hapla TaxID=6305 RepID=A0A1I8AYX3_MELHA
LLEYAKEISDNNMPISQLELDDMWTVSYGDYQIDKRKFSNFSEMLKKLENEYGIKRLSAWVHPFVNADSEIGKNPELLNKLFVKNRNGDVPLVWWWDCPVIPTDPQIPVGPTNPDKKEPCAYEGISTFKFDAGETTWLPHNYILFDGAYPNSYGKHYAHFASRFGSAVENRYGSGTQQTNFFTRTIDRNSYWALQSSLHGYYWNLPDMIGGNGLNHNESNISGEPPEDELYIRWTQANALLLAMQFSYPPWHSKYDKKLLDIVKNSLEIRKKWMSYLIKNVKKSVEKKVPVIRPMWWESDDNEALTIDDQFMVGSDLVVAPIIKSGQTVRNIYLPKGNWQDGNNNTNVITGPKTLKDYPSPIDVLPYFYRTNGDDSGNGGSSTFGTSMGLFSLIILLITSLYILN